MQSTMQSTGQNTTRSSLRLIGSIIMPLFCSFPPLLKVLDALHSQAIRGLDMVRSIAVGFCWGIAFAALMMLIMPKFRKS
jgi:hypothetical protein